MLAGFVTAGVAGGGGGGATGGTATGGASVGTVAAEEEFDTDTAADDDEVKALDEAERDDEGAVAELDELEELNGFAGAVTGTTTVEDELVFTEELRSDGKIVFTTGGGTRTSVLGALSLAFAMIWRMVPPSNTIPFAVAMESCFNKYTLIESKERLWWLGNAQRNPNEAPQ